MLQLGKTDTAKSVFKTGPGRDKNSCKKFLHYQYKCDKFGQLARGTQETNSSLVKQTFSYNLYF